MADEFKYDVFLSHSAKDKAVVVRPLAERLQQGRLKVLFDEWMLKPGDSIPAKIQEGLEHSRVLVLCTSAHPFGSDWARVEDCLRPWQLCTFARKRPGQADIEAEATITFPYYRRTLLR